MSALRHADVREALQLDALPRRLTREYRREQPLLERLLALSILYAFMWGGPLALPVSAFHGLHPIAVLVIAVFAVVIPCSVRASTRRSRTDAMRLYGPPETSVAIARVLRHAPWVLWAALCCAATPLCWVLARDEALGGAAWGIGASYFFVPIVIYSQSGRPGPKLEALGVFAILLVAVLAGARYAVGASQESWVLGVPRSAFAALAIATSLFAIVRNLARGVQGGAGDLPEESSELVEARARKPVEFAAPSVHRPARSAFEADRLLARLQHEYEWRSNPTLSGRAFAIFSLALRVCLPAAIALFCLQIDSYVTDKRAVPFGGGGSTLMLPTTRVAVSLGVLWLAAVLLGVSRELSGAQWLRGHDWREQFVAGRREWLQLCLLPVLAGVAIGLAYQGWRAGVLAAGALVLAGCLLREGAPWIFDVAGERLGPLLGLSAIAMGPVLYFVDDWRLSLRGAWITAALVTAVGIVSIAMRWRAATDERLGAQFRAEELNVELLE